jgi:hypothetical protein
MAEDFTGKRPERRKRPTWNLRNKKDLSYRERRELVRRGERST